MGRGSVSLVERYGLAWYGCNTAGLKGDGRGGNRASYNGNRPVLYIAVLRFHLIDDAARVILLCNKIIRGICDFRIVGKP